MVHRKARDKFAELLRHFIAGLITNEEFEDQVPHSPKDLAIFEIWWIATSPFFSDDEYTLTEEYRASGDERREIAKCVLFLKTVTSQTLF